MNACQYRLVVVVHAASPPLPSLDVAAVRCWVECEDAGFKLSICMEAHQDRLVEHACGTLSLPRSPFYSLNHHLAS